MTITYKIGIIIYCYKAIFALFAKKEGNIMEEKIIMTEAGLQKLKDELLDLKINKKNENVQKIKEARAQGDLSENAEYDAAKDEQREIAARIAELEHIIDNAEVISDDSKSRKVSLGSTVTVYDKKYKETLEFTIVGVTEANSLLGLISNESPLGAALIGHKKNDEIEVVTPNGKTLKYRIDKVSKAKN